MLTNVNTVTLGHSLWVTGWLANKNNFTAVLVTPVSNCQRSCLGVNSHLIWPITSTYPLQQSRMVLPLCLLVKTTTSQLTTFPTVGSTACFNPPGKHWTLPIYYKHFNTPNLSLHFFHTKSNHNPGDGRQQIQVGWSGNSLTCAASACEYEYMHDEYKATTKKDTSMGIYAWWNTR